MKMFLGLCLCVFAALSTAQAANAPTIKIENAWARSTAPGLPTGVVYFSISNQGTEDDILLSVSTPLAQAQLHESVSQNGVMSMRPLKEIAVPAGGRVVFGEGGKHVMLVGLKAPLVAGTTLPLTLHFRNAGAIDILVAVQDKAPASMGMEGMKMDGMDMGAMHH